MSFRRTHWFTEGFCTQVLVVYFLRTGKIPFLQSSPSRYLLASTIFFMGIAFVLPYIPTLNDLLGFVHIDPIFYGFLACILVSYCILVQFVKVAYIKIFKEWYVAASASLSIRASIEMTRLDPDVTFCLLFLSGFKLFLHCLHTAVRYGCSYLISSPCQSCRC